MSGIRARFSNIQKSTHSQFWALVFGSSKTKFGRVVRHEIIKKLTTGYTYTVRTYIYRKCFVGSLRTFFHVFFNLFAGNLDRPLCINHVFYPLRHDCSYSIVTLNHTRYTNSFSNTHKPKRQSDFKELNENRSTLTGFFHDSSARLIARNK